MKVKKDLRTVSYEAIIGLEIHVELATKSKMFCGCGADYFGHKPNTHCCPICLGLPGSLPVPNKKAVEWTVMVGLALNCKIPLLSKFDRKNYFYPDLPKGYQISQYDMPFAIDGELKLKAQSSKLKAIPTKSRILDKVGTTQSSKLIRIRRVHLEEDTGKMVHIRGNPLEGVTPQGFTLIDFNRSGVPLMEIVTEPDIRSGDEAKVFLQNLQQLLRYLKVSECDMEKGSMRVEPNVSVKLKTPFGPSSGRGQNSKLKTQEELDLPNYKVEIKNLNSFRFAKKAIDYEIQRQINLLTKGVKISQETRGWDETKEATFLQRKKEEAADYRYFPEPDIPPIRWTEKEIEKIRSSIPELPEVKLKRFMRKFGLSEYDGQILTTQREMADYYEEAIRVAHEIPNSDFRRKLAIKSRQFQIPNKTIANWIINRRVDIDKVLPAELIKMILRKHGPSVMGQGELIKIAEQVLLDNKKAVRDYKKGKSQALMFLVGQVMSRTRGKADPKVTAKLLNQRLSSEIK